MRNLSQFIFYMNSMEHEQYICTFQKTPFVKFVLLCVPINKPYLDKPFNVVEIVFHHLLCNITFPIENNYNQCLTITLLTPDKITFFCLYGFVARKITIWFCGYGLFTGFLRMIFFVHNIFSFWNVTSSTMSQQKNKEILRCYSNSFDMHFSLNLNCVFLNALVPKIQI